MHRPAPVPFDVHIGGPEGDWLEFEFELEEAEVLSTVEEENEEGLLEGLKVDGRIDDGGEDIM